MDEKEIREIVETDCSFTLVPDGLLLPVCEIPNFVKSLHQKFEEELNLSSYGEGFIDSTTQLQKAHKQALIDLEEKHKKTRIEMNESYMRNITDMKKSNEQALIDARIEELERYNWKTAYGATVNHGEFAQRIAQLKKER